MILLGSIIAIILMGAVISMALNKKSNFHTRVACLIALAVMILTVLICGFIILTDNRVPVDESNVIVGAPAITNEPGSGKLITLLLIIVFLLGLFAVIAIHSMKEHRKQIKNFF